MSQALSKKLQAFTPPEEMLLLIPTRRICWHLSFHRLFCYGGQHWAAQTRAALLCKTFKSNKMGSARTLADWLSAEGLGGGEWCQTTNDRSKPLSLPTSTRLIISLATVQLSNRHIIKHVWQKCRITYHNWSVFVYWNGEYTKHISKLLHCCIYVACSSMSQTVSCFLSSFWSHKNHLVDDPLSWWIVNLKNMSQNGNLPQNYGCQLPKKRKNHDPWQFCWWPFLGWLLKWPF